MHVHQTTKSNALTYQLRERIDLLLAPIVCFVTRSPEIVILFLNACDYDASAWFAQVTLCAYYISFVVG